MENRESGVNPGRTHHCKEEPPAKPLGDWEGAGGEESESGDLPVDLWSIFPPKLSLSKK